jgi:hypothetical protein
VGTDFDCDDDVIPQPDTDIKNKALHITANPPEIIFCTFDFI